MKKFLSFSTLGLAGLVGAGLMTMPGTALAGADQDAVLKRDDQVTDIVLVDDDDDDSNDNSNSRASRTGNSRSRADNTNSRMTAVSRDRDRSRRDLTKDWTRDGGDRTRDWSKNKTNDKSRNDTRGRR